MNKKSSNEMDGTVIEVMPNKLFRVELENGHVITANVTGKMRISNIKIIPGDKVKVELSPHDLFIGEIVYKAK